jgi:hypothetical protein
VASGNCTNCHGDLNAHGKGLTIQAREITAFRERRHPEFSAVKFQDARPLRLNHAIHMPKEPKVIRGMKLPMACGDCHVTDKGSATGALLPVTFEANCKSCHARELEFDVHHVLGPNAKPAPHTKDPETIRAYIVKAYKDAMAADPSIVRKPPLNELTPASMWLDRMVKDSEEYLFGRKCGYCHEGGKPMEAKAGRVTGRYPDAKPWFEHGEFSHRAHRAVTCESCHTAARGSSKTADVLVPKMSSCVPCHGGQTAGLDRCSECHLYHDRKLEKEPARRPVQSLTGGTP